MTEESAKQLRVALVGGIYGKPEEYRRRFSITPETTLESGLRSRGVRVSTFSHHIPVIGEFDVVHVHHLSWGALRASIHPSRAALVFTPHNGQDMAGRLEWNRQQAMGFTLRRADAVVALSDREAAFHVSRYGVRPEAVKVIVNGINAAQYSMDRSNRAGHQARWEILYVGQLDPIKRVDLLLRAAAALNQPVNIKLVYQNGRLEEELKMLAKELGIGPHVHFLGIKGPQELCKLYNDADVFVLPSSSEALPSVVTEAMLTGTPVIATDTGGVRSQLAGFGRLVACGDVAELTLAMASLFADYEAERLQSAAMARHARQTFSTDRMISEHLLLYRSLCDKNVRQRQRTEFRPLNRLAGSVLSFREG